MRIGVDVSCLEVARTGVRTYVEELVSALEADARHMVIRLRPKRPALARGRLSKALRHLRHQWWIQIGLPRAARASQCDVLLGPEYEVPLRAPCPRVVVFHDAAFWRNPQQYNAAWRAIINGLAVPAARSAARIITVSQFARDDLARRLDFDLRRLVVVPNAAKHLPQPDGDTIHNTLSRFGLQSRRFFLHVGVLEHRKNLVRLVDAFARVACTSDMQLVLAGQPAPKAAIDATGEIRTRIAQYGLDSRVILTGFLADNELAALYRTALAVVLPSLMEGFGIPILEAFEHGVPVLSSDASALPEVAGPAALYFSPTDCEAIASALRRIIEDESLRTCLIRGGTARAKEFSWSATAARTIDILEEVAAVCSDS